jgi:hypothetical protein
MIKPSKLTPTMNPDEFSNPTRRVFLKRSAYSAVATTFAFSSTSILTSCQTTGKFKVKGYGVEAEGEWSGSGSKPSSVGPLTINGTNNTATNTSDHPVTVTGSDGESITIQPGETVQIQQ